MSKLLKLFLAHLGFGFLALALAAQLCAYEFTLLLSFSGHCAYFSSNPLRISESAGEIEAIFPAFIMRSVSSHASK